MSIKIATHRELQLTADHNIQVGSLLDARIGTPVPLYIDYVDNEEFWDEKEEISIRQTEFASLGISYMFFKDSRINKHYPNIYRDAWIPFNESQEKGDAKITPLPAFQQLSHDRINCKIIGTGEQIDAIRDMKQVEDVGDILYVFDILEKWNVQLNIPKPLRKKIYTAKGSMEIEVTNIEDYDFDVDYEEMNWRDYKSLIDADKEWHRVDRRLDYLVNKLEVYEERIDPNFKKFGEILIDAYPILKMYEIPQDYYSLGPKDLAENIGDISKMYNNASYRSIWQTWYNYIVPKIKREINYLLKDH